MEATLRRSRSHFQKTRSLEDELRRFVGSAEAAMDRGGVPTADEVAQLAGRYADLRHGFVDRAYPRVLGIRSADVVRGRFRDLAASMMSS